MLFDESNLLNICIWFITDHKLASEDKLAKPSINDNNVIVIITPWIVVLNDLATSEELQFPGVQSLIFSLIIFWTGPVAPETTERMLKV